MVEKRSADMRMHALGQMLNSAGWERMRTRLALALLLDADGENDWVDDFENCAGTCAAFLKAAATGAEVVVHRMASEHSRAPLSAEEGNSFLGDAQSLDLLRLAQRRAALDNQLHEEPDSHRIEAAVELNVVHREVSGDDLCAADAQCGCVLDNLLTYLGQKDADVLEAVLVAAGIHDAVGVDTHLLAPCECWG